MIADAAGADAAMINGAPNEVAALRIPPSCSLPVSHACGPHVASFVRRSSACAPAGMRACGRVRRAAQRVAGKRKERPCAHAGGRCEQRNARCRSASLPRRASARTQAVGFGGF